MTSTRRPTANRPFFCRLLTSDNVRDADGRPLGERRAVAEVREGVPMEMRLCPYPGRRRRLPMNVSALEQMTSRWPEVLQGLHALHCGYLSHLGRTEVLGGADALGVSVACVALPIFLVDRDDDPCADGELPGVVGAIYKVAVGVYGLLRHMLQRHAADPHDRRFGDWSAANVVEMAEESGRLTAGNEACAGPPHLVVQALEAILHGSLPANHRRVPFEVVAPRRFFEVAVCSTDTALLGMVLDTADRFAEARLLRAFAARQAGARDPVSLQAIGHVPVIDNGPPVGLLPGAVGSLLDGCRRVPEPLRLRMAGYVQGPLPPAVEPRLLELLAASHAGAPMPDDGRAWLASEILAYAGFRRAYLSAVEELERRTGEALRKPPSPVRTDDRLLFTRLHTNAWLEALGGVRIDVEEGGLRVRFRERELWLA